MFRTKPLIIAVAGFLILIGIVAWSLSRPRSPASSEGQNPPSAGETSVPTPAPAANPTPGQSGSPTTGPAPTTPPAKTSIVVLSPTSVAKWVAGEINKIQWSKEAGVTGAIYLINTADNSIAGWITQSTNVHQTYYEWNTRDVFVSRTSPSKKTVERGQYIVKVIFDGGKTPIEIASAPFSIIYPSEMQISNYTLTIQNYILSPSSLTVKKGSKLLFVNNDSVTHKIILSSYPAIVINPGASITFDTSSLFSGSYNFYSEAYPTLKFVLIVQ